MRKNDFLAAGLVAVALHTAPAVAQEAETIRVMALPSIFANMYKAVGAAFEEENPGIRVDMNTAIREDEEAIQTVLRGAITGGVPDVLYISPNTLRIFADRDLTTPLDSMLEAETDWKSAYSDSVTAVGEMNGKIHALGFAVSMPTVMFNLDLVERAGGSRDSLPATWPEIVELGRRINALDPAISGAFFEHDNGGNWTFHALVESFGGRLMSPDETEVAFNSEAGLNALGVFRDFGKAGQAEVDMTRDQARQSFSAGALGILVTSSSSYARYAERAEGNFEIAMRPLPIPAPEGKIPAAGPLGLMLTKDPAKQKAAWAFMKFAAGPKGQEILAKNTGYLPINALALSLPAVQTYYETQPNMKAILPAISRMKSWYAFPGENSVRIIDLTKDYLHEVVTLRKAPDQALTGLSQDVTALLPKQ